MTNAKSSCKFPFPTCYIQDQVSLFEIKCLYDPFAEVLVSVLISRAMPTTSTFGAGLVMGAILSFEGFVITVHPS
jgi:hypothetical protein